MSNFSFAIVSDVHVKSSGQIPEPFSQVVTLLCSLGLRFVVVNGDSTVGNPDDGISEARVNGWWHSFQDALLPLRTAGIAVLPIAGNHDSYTENHRRGYANAWAGLASEVTSVAPPGALFGQPPHYYSFVLDGVFFLFLHVIDQDISHDVENFIRAQLASDAAKQASLRLCFGHVPLVSMMGRTSQSFCNNLGGLLASGGVAAYFSGHEHLVWDQVLNCGGVELRQVHVGTAGGTFHFPLSSSTYAQYCQGNTGTIPYTGVRFELIPGTRQQKDEITLTIVDISTDGDGTLSYAVRPLALRDGQLVPFGIPSAS